MTDVYREAPHSCPACGLGMRVFQQRLVCDGCNSMQLAVSDFEQQAGAGSVVVTDDTATHRACPRCGQRMKSCRLTVGGHEVDGDTIVMHCPGDGLWFPGESLEAVFTAIGQAGHRGSAHGSRAYGGVSGGGPGLRGIGTAISAVDAAFSRGASDPNEPLRWWEKRRPRVIVPFRSAFGDQRLGCPKCAGRLHLHGSIWGCDAGDGVFVEYDALAAMIFEMSSAPWEAPPADGPAGARPCPACETPMHEGELEGVHVGRCGTHGVWFDEGELEQALHHSGEPKPGWFRRLFHL